MYSILIVSLHGFYPSERSGKRVVYHSDGFVVGAAGERLDRGVSAGMAVSEARAILGDKALFVPFVLDEHVERRDRWLEVCSAFSDGVQHTAPHEAYIDLTGHPSPARAAVELLRAIDGVVPVSAVWAGLAPGKWLAALASRETDKKATILGIPSFEVVTDVSDFLSRIPTRMLAPIHLPHREKLEFLGYRWAREVATAPVTALSDQFGKDAFLIHEVANGRAMDTVAPNFPERSVSASMSFGYPLDDSNELSEAIGVLSRRLGAELCSRDLTAKGVTLAIEIDGCPPAVVRRHLAKPVQAATLLRAALSALYAQARVQQPPVGIKVQLFGLASAPRGQKSILGTEGGEERARACDAAVSVLKAAFGETAVKPAKDIVLPRRERVLSVWRHATGWR
ncbi:MAG: hypothetical protein JSS66_11620 [Armatimonadetes bacterium]|nr:hypothetical protein [Armatimonadota bacterium]